MWLRLIVGGSIVNFIVSQYYNSRTDGQPKGNRFDTSQTRSDIRTHATTRTRTQDRRRRISTRSTLEDKRMVRRTTSNRTNSSLLKPTGLRKRIR
uniref:Putative secreted protein n=1 Tax=Anopheles marajoara TaxID=58244 RepID=A0A2M4C9C0_9DIPT